MKETNKRFHSEKTNAFKLLEFNLTVNNINKKMSSTSYSMGSTDSVCFSRQDFRTYMFLFLTLIVYIVYILYSHKENLSNVDFTTGMGDTELRNKIIRLQDELYELQKSEQRCKMDLAETQQFLQKSQPNQVPPRVQVLLGQQIPQTLPTSTVNVGSNINNDIATGALLNKIYNPLVSPDRYYPGGKLNAPSFQDYQMIGYIWNSTNDTKLPLYGRYKIPGRSEKWEYYVIDESRRGIKIPFKSKNDNELYDGDTVDVPTVGNGWKAKIYEYDQFRYNPDLL